MKKIFPNSTASGHPYDLGIAPLWFKLSWFSLLLFVVGTFLSRSLVEFAIVFAALISLAFFQALYRWEGLPDREKTETTSPWIWVAWSLSGAIFFYWLGWLGFRGEWEFAIKFGLALGWALSVWMLGWSRGLFSGKEIGLWWFCNGLLWWFTVAFALRDIDEGTLEQVKGVFSFVFSFALPFSVFYLFIKLSGNFFFRRLRILLLTGLSSLLLLALMGLPGFFSLGDHWAGWVDISQSLSLNDSPGRLSSFHFVLDLGNILAQGLFISMGWALSTSGQEQPQIRKWWGWGVSFLLFFLFLLTWMKLLIPAVLLLMGFFLVLALRSYTQYFSRYFYRFFLGLVILITMTIALFLNTDNLMRGFSDDLMEVATVVAEEIKGEDPPTLVEKLIEKDLISALSFIYRIQHHIWAYRIFREHPLTGIGPYAYTDYVIAHYKKDMMSLPSIITREVGEEEKRRLIESETDISRALLSTHSDWVMISTSGGIPGMIFYYGFFLLLLHYFFSRYRRGGNGFHLGIGFALLAMLASGITEPNFKSVHFQLFTFYSLYFFTLKFSPKGLGDEG